jgi:hypothetical protein
MRLITFSYLLLPVLLSAAPKEQVWKTGTITADSSISAAPPRHSAVDPHLLHIRGDGFLYTAQEKHAWTGWCLLIQGEQIKYAEDGRKLSIVDADGQKCTLNIVSQEKLPTP